MKSLRNILVAVVLVSVLALVYLTYDSTAQLAQRTPPLTDDVIKGKEAWATEPILHQTLLKLLPREVENG